MKLTQEQIQFIEDYLIKSEVKYWDVRIELLDHIVSAVEDKMTSKKMSFEDALLEVHQSFGNKIFYKESFIKSLYQNNKGYEKFVRKRQKEIATKQRKEYWRSFPKLLKSKHLIIEFILGLSVVLTMFQFNPKWSLVIAYILCISPELLKPFYAMKSYKMIKKSLFMEMKQVSLGFFFLVFSGSLLNWFKAYFENSNKPYETYLIVIFSMLYLFFRHSYNNYRKDLDKYAQQYKLLKSK